MNPIRSVPSGVKRGSPILTGLAYSLVIMAAATVVTSLLYKFTGLKESTMGTSVYIIHSLSLFIGGLAAGRKAEKKGWYYGGLMGIVYSILITLIGFLSYDAAFTAYTSILFGLSFVAGAFGGMIGVNLRP